MPTPHDILWGAATAAYQIEGGIAEDGRGESIWDRFSHTPGTIELGANGDIAADHYHQWRTDIALMSQLELQAYRFSVAWPRILPQGRGAINAAGLDFYEKLVDALLKANIQPFITLYHWDLPQRLQDAGGWLNRDTAKWFADYADIATRRLGDRVTHWITLNEPCIVAFNGHVEGVHAPGLKGFENLLPVMHHQLLGHGLALLPMRQNIKHSRIGIAYNLARIEPFTDRDEDCEAAETADALFNRLALDPALKGTYPAQGLRYSPTEIIEPGDMAIISSTTDFAGINYYLNLQVRAQAQAPGFTVMDQPRSPRMTTMYWAPHPAGLRFWINRIATDYPDHDIYITENGAAYEDRLSQDGAIHDPLRMHYLQEHIHEVLSAQKSGQRVKGYFVWSLLDNFEWARGYTPRFGIVFVDYATQWRIIKDSGLWYRRFIATGNLDAGLR